MITKNDKEEEIQLINSNHNNTDTSNTALRKVTLDSLIPKKGSDSLISEHKNATITPRSTNRKVQTGARSQKRTISIKLFKEDEDSNKKMTNIILEPGESPQYMKDDSESNDYDNYLNNPNHKDEEPFEKANRRLCKREKICDTDTEDSASDDENEMKWIITPNCTFKKIWNAVIALAILYSSIVSPYGIAFDDNIDDNFFEYIIDILLGIDIILNFFCAYTDKDENLIKNHRKIIITYIKSWFFIDLISVLPFNLFFRNNGDKAMRSLRMPKLYRLFRITKLVRITKIIKKGNISSITKILLEKLKLNSNIEKLIYFLLTFFLLSHLSTCLWYFVAKMEDLSPDSWVVRLGFIDNSNFHLYILSFYWTLTTVTTVGYGDISAGTTPERIYNLFIMSFGVLMYSFAIGSLSSIVAALDQKTAEMNQKLQILASIKKEYHLDKTIYDKVRKVLKFDLSRNQRDKMQFLQELPNKLRIELSQIMHDKAIQHLNFFRDQPNDFFAYVAPLLKPVKCCQNDYLYKCEDMIDEMYFVSKGTIIFCLEKKYEEKEIKEIKKNNNFGEIEMCLTLKLCFNIKVKSRNSELFVLKKNDFLRLSVNFKEFIENFLHKSFMIYLKYNKERKKMIEDYEELMNKVNPKYSIKNVDDNINGTNITNEDYYNEECHLLEKPITESVNMSQVLSSTKAAKNDEFKTKFNNALIEAKFMNPNFTTKKSIMTDSLIENGSPNMNYAKKPNEKGSDNQFNAKFQKKVESILDYLEKNGISFDVADENPRELLEQLKYETNAAKKEHILFKIEEILKKIYT